MTGAAPTDRCVPGVMDGMALAQIRRRDPVFRTASAFCLLVGVVEVLRNFPALLSPVGVSRPPDSDLATWILAVDLAVPLAYAICGALMLLRGSAAAAVLAVLVALASMLALGVNAVVGPPLSITLQLVHSVLVIAAGVLALAQAAMPSRAAHQSAPPTAPRGATPAQHARRDKVFLAASVVCLLVGATLGVLLLITSTQPSVDSERGLVGLGLTIWFFTFSLAWPAAYVIPGALMLLRGSTAAAVFAVLVAVLDLLPFGWRVVNGSPLAALLAVPFLLVVVMGIWAVVRVSRSPRSALA